MKPTYESALIMRRAKELEKRYGKWKGMHRPGCEVACVWIRRAIDRLRKIGAWEEAEELNQMEFMGDALKIKVKDLFL